MSVAEDLRQAWRDGKTIIAPGIFDAFSARLIEHLGFSAAYLGGHATGVHLGTPEPLVTMTEQVEMARRVAGAVRLPVVTDGDAGFGDALHTMRAVEEFAAAGVAGIHIEDQVYPKRMEYHRGLEYVIPADDYLRKMEFALKARARRDIVIIGRIDSIRAANGSREDAQEKADRLVEMGIDGLLIQGMKGSEDYRYFAERYAGTPLTLVVGEMNRSIKELKELGYGLLILPIQVTATATQAIVAWCRELLAGDTIPGDPEAYRATRQIIEKLTGIDDYLSLESATPGEA